MTEHDDAYLSECCEGFPINGELDLTPDGPVGVCQVCREAAPFVCLQCEEDEDGLPELR